MRIVSAALGIALFAQIGFIPASQAQSADIRQPSAPNVADAMINNETCPPVQHRRHRALRTYTKQSTVTTTTTAPAQTQVPPTQPQAEQPPTCAPTTCAPATIIQQPAVVEGAPPPVVFSHHTNLGAWLVGGVLLATAIAVPIAVPLGIRHHHREEARRRAAIIQQQQLLLFNSAG